MIPVKLSISYSRKRQVKSYEPEEFWTSIDVALEPGDDMESIWKEQMAKIQGLIDNVVLAEEAEATLTERLGNPNQYLQDRANDPQHNDVEEYSDLPFSDEPPQGSPGPPQQGLRVERGTNAKGEFWKVSCPAHGPLQQDGMSYAKMWPASSNGPANVKCSKNTNGEWCKFSVPADKAWAIVNRQS